MKKYICLIVSITYLAAGTIKSQEVTYPMKFFTLRHTRVAVGLGWEGTFDKKGHGETLMYNYRGNSENIEMVNPDSTPYIAWKFVLDFYSPNSIISFSSGLNYSYLTFGLASTVGPKLIDNYEITCLDIPAYLKFSFGSGSRTKPTRFFLNLGAIYSIPSSVERTYTLLSRSEIDRSKMQLTGNNWIPSAMLGIDIHMGFKRQKTQTYANWRLSLFTKFDYRIKSLINSNYEDFSSTSSINYKNYEFKDSRLSVGLSISYALH